MSIHAGPFAIYLWLDAAGDGEPDSIEYANTEEECVSKAEKFIQSGRYKYAWLGKLNTAIDDYEEIGELPE